MSGRLSEATEQVREAGAEDSGSGCCVMVSLGEVSTRAVVRLRLIRGRYKVSIVRGVRNV